MKIQYKTVMGIIEIDVDEEWGNRVLELNRADYNSERKGHRYSGVPTSLEESEVSTKRRSGWMNTNGVLEDLIRNEDKNRLHRAVDMLPEDQRELVTALFFEEVKAVDYARSMGISRSAISQRLDRALKSLKKIFLQTH